MEKRPADGPSVRQHQSKITQYIAMPCVTHFFTTSFSVNYISFRVTLLDGLSYATEKNHEALF